jgi:inner membrane protein
LDIVTQGLLGAALAQAAASTQEVRIATGIGFASALLADADTLIRSADDPLLNIEFHRHFTHSLIFIPIGGLLAALILWPFLRRHITFKRLYFFAFLAYATSGLLDACTSYGTQLLWPFSDERIAWRIIAIVDPVFSIALLVAIIFGARKHKTGFAQIGLCIAGMYLLLGVFQHQRAFDVAEQLAAQREHQIERMIVKPTMANLLLWRSVYESDGVFYVDGIRVGLFDDNRVYQGNSAKRFVPDRDIPELDASSALHHDIERFLYFSEGYVITDSTRDNVLVDVRYSMLPTGLAPLWGIDMNVESKTQHAQFVNYRDRTEDTRERFISMLLGREIAED